MAASKLNFTLQIELRIDIFLANEISDGGMLLPLTKTWQ